MRGLAPVLLCTVLLVWVYAAPEEKYSTKWDHINVDEIMKSERLIRNYANCFNDKGACSPDGADMKEVLPDAIETGCGKCSEKQKEIVMKVLRFLINKKPEIWKELSPKYDPDGKYTEKYMEGLKTLVD